MNTKSFLPPLQISSYVSSILVIENWDNTTGFVLPLYANGAPTIVFQTALASRENNTVDNLTLYGQTVTPGELSFTEIFTLIAYFLYPHALKSLFSINAAELTNKYIDLCYLKQAREMNLQEQLLNEPLLDARLQLINDFIFDLSNLNHTDINKILFATNELKQNTDSNSLRALQKKLNTTERSLQRLFETNVGISPKMFKRVCQFHLAFQQLNQNEFSKLTDIAYEHGFADQSHFIRVFTEFTGLTPKEYLNKRAPYNPKF